MKTVAHLIMNLLHFQMSGRADPACKSGKLRGKGLGETSSIIVHTSDETTQDPGSSSRLCEDG